jgi:catechol 2,3-dioxygenase-like lactoylglutathione lyase family enzyme
MMLKELVYVALFVADQDKALAFYTDVLGFEKRLDTPTPEGGRFLTIGLPGQELVLVLWPGVPGKGQPVQGRVPGTYTIETEDCREAFAALKARGVRFETAEVLEAPWGLSVTMLDPDGNRLTLREGRKPTRA